MNEYLREALSGSTMRSQLKAGAPVAEIVVLSGERVHFLSVKTNSPAPKEDVILKSGNQSNAADSRLVSTLCDVFLEWLESQGYNSMESAELVAQLRAEAEEIVNG